jgi:hypothetical protein
MSFIGSMTIRGVDIEDCGDGQTQRSFHVDAATLDYHYPDEYHEDLGEGEFFNLACQYLEDYVANVLGTDYANIDTWYPLR